MSESLLRRFGFFVASKSTLQRCAAKLDLLFQQKLLRVTLKGYARIVGIDATDLSKTLASEHYIKRIDAKSRFTKGLTG